MRLAPYGIMFYEEVSDLLTRRMDAFLCEHITDPDLYAYSAVSAPAGLFYVLLDDMQVKGFCRLDLGARCPGTAPITQIHDFVAEDGYGRKFQLEIDKLLLSLGIEVYQLWIRHDKPHWLSGATKAYDFSPRFTVGWATIPQKEEEPVPEDNSETIPLMSASFGEEASVG